MVFLLEHCVLGDLRTIWKRHVNALHPYLGQKIKKLQCEDFGPNRNDLRYIAYKFAVTLKIPPDFNVDEEKASYDWLQSFLRRNLTLLVRKSEGTSMTRAEEMRKVELKSIFLPILSSVLEKTTS
ncbi:hypothetical protein Zmor_014895 [Zophobas morio]|uniref:Uncharacterized protein n=1 Tax=Zophobas morio TaxID=2755281 RepID=A0AA38IL53_9CUCU|nr:hypothetical protein Zmor_014895 [Zophobas morio]